MEFNKLVIDVLMPIFTKYNFHIEDQYENYLELKSDKIVLILSHNKLDKINSLSISGGEYFSYPIKESILKRVFESKLKIDSVIPEVFVENLRLFFIAEGRSLLEGNMTVLYKIRELIHKENKEYTAELLYSQSVESANKAWKDADYGDFIKHVDAIGLLNLPVSYQQKYKIAQKKVRPLN
ncbi:MAG TPA: hypothetical protein VNS58_26585 [Puia sp.]|nr:hypothetical protein [Puia sp.]